MHVDLTVIPDTQYVTKFATAVRGRDVPDVVGIDDINSTLLAYHDALTNMTPLLDQLPFRNQLSPGHLNLATIHGRAYAIPVAADISVLFYNKRIFAAAGLGDRITRRARSSEVLSDARAITAKVHSPPRVTPSPATTPASSASPACRSSGPATPTCSPGRSIRSR